MDEIYLATFLINQRGPPYHTTGVVVWTFEGPIPKSKFGNIKHTKLEIWTGQWGPGPMYSLKRAWHLQFLK